MLTKLLPDQISTFWDVIKFAIEESLPPTVGEHPDKMNRILSACMGGSIDVWASYERGEEVNRFEGILLTKILFDDSSGTYNLLIYCMYGYNDVSRDSWLNGFNAILKYAKAKRCSRIVGYTEIPHVVALAKSLGGDTRYTFVSFDVNSSLNYLTEFKSENNN